MLNDPKVVPLTYWQIRLLDRHWTPDMLPDDAPSPRPQRLSTRYIVSPDSYTYCCEVTPSLYLDPLDCQFEWDDYNAVTEEVSEWYDSHAIDLHVGAEGEYHHVSSLIASPKGTPGKDVVWRDIVIARHIMGEYDSDQEGQDDAREAAQGNHYV